MSSALPAAFLRPSCAALRTSVPITQQWNAVTLAFARRFCAQQSFPPSSGPSTILAALQSRPPPLAAGQCRPFSSSLRASASVSKPAASAPPPPKGKHQQTRVVKIGLLPTGDVDAATIKSIFGKTVSMQDGNHVLRILHHRRVSGSLADYGVANLGHRYRHVSSALAMKGLEWLRKAFPIDEARAAEEWAEKEANRISYELWLTDPENADSKYNDPARVFQAQQRKMEEEQEHEEQRIGMLYVGPSQIERHVEEQRKERLEAMARKAEEREKKEKEDEEKLATGEWVRTPGGTGLMRPGQKTYLDPFGREHIDRRDEYQKYYQKKAETPFKSEEEMLNSTTLTQRLLPMTVFVFFVCILSFGLGHYYIPPDPEYRLWPDLSPTTATLAGLVALNFVGCALWRVSPLWPLMTRFMMHVPGYPRAFQAVGNVFSHVQYEHLLGNMMFLVLVGSVCHDMVGRGVFLGTYISAGAVGTLVSLYWANLGAGNISAHSVGASAAIWGVATLYCLLTEKDRIKIPFVKDQEVGFYPKMLLGAFVAMEIYTMLKGRTTMDHASHIGGFLTGMAVAGFMHKTGFRARDRSAAVDVGAMVRDEAVQVKEGVKSAVKTDDK
ncbi:hypothetical protein CC78DRAFT_566635 [Lojkania enalia]|uniref:Peptidase S54 rhomboid domain-containing protein n=1 Tax=Lojkania enalia TaxID=147567 RepID=A0A9P4N633_9PLEO|nr:hypothetical protein CC78DRAFT_566635 [Didymosphaeria enalia]